MTNNTHDRSSLNPFCFSEKFFCFLLYFVLRVCDNKWTHSRGSSWRGRSQVKRTQSGSSELKRMQFGLTTRDYI